MFIAYVTVALVAAAANVWAASTDFRRTKDALNNIDTVEVPRSWLAPLGALKVVGAAGLSAGITVPLLGALAAGGLVLFFVCAVFAHLRVSWYSTLPYPLTFLALAAGALVLRLASFTESWPAL